MAGVEESAFQRAMAEMSKQMEHSNTVYGAFYANMTDAEREAIVQKARDRNLVELEEAVELACQAIYEQRNGYRPSVYERRNIAIALLTHECDPW